MSTKLKAIILMLTVVVGTSALSAYIAFSDDQAVLDAAMQRELSLVGKMVERSSAEQLAKASARAALIASLPPVQQALRAQDRELLVRLLLTPMQLEREQYGVVDAQFHLPPATSFLRLFDLQQPPGEDLSKLRPMVVAANRQQSPQEGITIGRRGIGLRSVYPVADGDGHIGSFEIGMDFTTIVHTIKDTTGFEAAVLVERQLMRDIATLVPAPEDYKLVGDYQMLTASNWEVIKPLLPAEKLRSIRKPAQHTRVLDGEMFGTVVLPLRDSTGTVVGSLVAARSFEHYVKQRNWAMVRSAATAGLQVLLLAGVVLLIINGMVLRPLAALTRMVDGAPEALPGERQNLLQRRDEIGKLAQHLAQAAGSGREQAAQPGSGAADKESAHG